MSSSAYASILKNLGGPFQTRNPSSGGASGYGPHREDAAESAAPQAIPVLNSEPVDVERITDKPVRKKRKTTGVKPPKGMDPVVEGVVCDDEGKGPDGEEVWIGTFTLQQLASTMSPRFPRMRIGLRWKGPGWLPS